MMVKTMRRREASIVIVLWIDGCYDEPKVAAMLRFSKENFARDVFRECPASLYSPSEQVKTPKISSHTMKRGKLDTTIAVTN
jgi:hypothetical protein